MEKNAVEEIFLEFKDQEIPKSNPNPPNDIFNPEKDYMDFWCWFLIITGVPSVVYTYLFDLGLGRRGVLIFDICVIILPLFYLYFRHTRRKKILNIANAYPGVIISCELYLQKDTSNASRIFQ